MKSKVGILSFITLFYILLTTSLYALELSSQEKSYLKNNNIVRVGVVGNMPPLEYYGAGYKHQGIVSDFLKKIVQKLNLTIEYKVGSSEELLEMIIEGELDMLSFAIKDRINENFLLFTDPYLELHNSIFVKKDSQTVNHMNDLSEGLVAMVHYSSLESVLKEKFQNIRFRYTASTHEAFELVFAQEVEAFIESSLVGDYIVNRSRFIDKIKEIEIPWLKTPLRLATSNKKPMLRDLLQKALADIDYKAHNDIVQKWVLDMKQYKKMPISFTDKENEYIKSHPIINVGLGAERKPLSYFEKGKIQGVISSYLEAITEKTGIQFQAKQIENFSSMLNAIKDKKIEMIDAIVPTKQRAKYMDFSTQYLSLDNIIVVRSEEKKLDTVGALANKKVGVIKDDIVGKYLSQDVPSATMMEYEDVAKGLRALSGGKLDAFLLDLPAFDYYTAKHKIPNLVVSANTPYSYPIHFGVSKGEGTLISILNKALNSIDENEQNKIYRKWVSVKFVPKIDYALVWRVVGVFLLFLLAAFYWNRKLAKEIEKRIEIEKQLVVAKETAEDATKAKSTFLANMSHEIRTPMNSVIGFADLLDGLIKDPIQKGYLRSIQIGGKALLGIINDILDLSKIEAGQLKVMNESVNVHNLFLEMRQLFHDKIGQKNLTFDIDIELDIPKYLILDGVKLRQILLNLLSNAIKFTEQGGIVLSVGREFKDSQKSQIDLHFKVQDTGVGIPENFLETIFEAFTQKEKQSIKKYGGTGLGLSICKRLIEIMNGSIEVESEVGVGSTFKVLLRDIGVSSLKEHPEDEVFTDVEFEESTILIVDDIEENRELVRAVFSSKSLKIKEAKDGKEAIEMVEDESVDLIFMDLQMPILNGYDATIKLREKYSQEALPIVALTASVMGEELQKVKEFGFNGYLRKPTSKQALVKEAAKYLPCKKEIGEEYDSQYSVLFETQDIKEEFAKRLNNEYMQEWREIKDRGDVELVRKLNDKLATLLKVQELNILREYVDKMVVCIESFDLVEMYSLLNAYPNLVEKIGEGEVKQDV